MLDRETIVAALAALSERLGVRGVSGEINLVGGTAMVLGFQARQVTKDVDAIFVPTGIIREEARVVAGQLGIPENWLNDAAKGFASQHGDFLVLPDLELPNLRVLIPAPEYLLAMKVLAARASGFGVIGDRDDSRGAGSGSGYRTPADVIAKVEKYYDPSTS